ncbi:Na+/H+ antiporter NhaC family protein [Phosphitispora sp. TUW77]|uniref:Na+/H+ antiporter NhaC family protein n=1 Tax=Phosphitispora sp. TUW77 TaxID=3152361 RepID=UPI003AB321A5
MESYGAISLIPAAIVVILALVTRKTLEPLLIGSITGFIILSKENFFTEFVNASLKVLGDPTIGWVILVCGFMGSLIAVLEKSGGANSFALLAIKYANTRKKSLFFTWLVGLCLFIDDYLNVLTVGSTMKKVTDKHLIPRVFLAYSVGSTAAPICVLVPFSTWAVFFASLLANEGLTVNGSSIGAYIQSIPYIFYGWAAVFIILPLVISGIIPLVGPMKKADDIALKTGQLFPADYVEANQQVNAEDKTEASPENAGGILINFILPIIVLIAATIAMDIDLLKGVIVAMVFTAMLYKFKGIMKYEEFMNNCWEGFQSMVVVLGVVIVSFIFKEANDGLGLTNYVIETVKPMMNGGWLPAVTFLVTAGIAFATATFWGLAAIMIPIVIPLSLAMGVDPFLTSGAVFSGAAFGSHACFYSDSAILIAKATGIRPYDHAITQLPYAIIAALLSTAFYIFFGFA